MMTDFLLSSLAPSGVRLVVTSYSYQDTGGASRRYHGAIPLISQPRHSEAVTRACHARAMP